MRDPTGNIIQFLYGEDGIDPAKSDHGRPVNLDRVLGSAELSNRSRSKFGEKDSEAILAKYETKLNKRLFKELGHRLAESNLDEDGVKGVIDKVMESIDYATVEPGEASGIVAAQSIGEPGTQMSIAAGEGVIVREGGRVRTVKIGEFVDDLMLKHPVSKEAATEWCDMPAGLGIEVPSLDSDGKIHWKALRSSCPSRLSNFNPASTKTTYRS